MQDERSQCDNNRKTRLFIVAADDVTRDPSQDCMIANRQEGARGGWLILVDVLWYETIEPSNLLNKHHLFFNLEVA